MRRKIITLFVCLFLAIPAWSAPRGALFKVEGGGHTLYLFGTMHVGLPEFYPLENTIEDAVAHAPVLALEIDPAKDPAVVAQVMQRHGLLAPGAKGYDTLPADYRARLEKLLTRSHMQLAAVSSLRPWLLATMLALQEFAQQGYRPELAVDAHLAQAARAHQVKVEELESVEGQLSLFSRLSADEQWRFLEDTIDAMESGKQEHDVKDIVDAWSHADQKALDDIAARAEADDTFSGKFVQQVMLDGRNGALADKLVALLKRADGNVAAIGVLHLVGKHSVPALLRAQGVKVERVY